MTHIPWAFTKAQNTLFPINNVDITGLHYGNHIYFGQLQKIRPTKFTLKAFKILFDRTVVIHAVCEKL